MDKWKSLYGSTIVSSLAYIQAKRGNNVLARQYLNDYHNIYGSNSYDKNEEDHLHYVRYILEE